MNKKIVKAKKGKSAAKWILLGLDMSADGEGILSTDEDEGDAIVPPVDPFYHIPGKYETEHLAEEGARRFLKELKSSRPRGAKGVLDYVYVVSLSGDKRRFTG